MTQSTDLEAAPLGPSDAELIAAVRGGDAEAYGALFERHAGAARNLARQHSRNDADADDLVSEAFAKVLQVLHSGGGPDVSFRAYLFTTLRRVAYDRTRAGAKVQLTDDLSALARNFAGDRARAAFGAVDRALTALERNAGTKVVAEWLAVQL